MTTRTPRSGVFFTPLSTNSDVNKVASSVCDVLQVLRVLISDVVSEGAVVYFCIGTSDVLLGCVTMEVVVDSVTGSVTGSVTVVIEDAVERFGTLELAVEDEVLVDGGIFDVVDDDDDDTSAVVDDDSSLDDGNSGVVDVTSDVVDDDISIVEDEAWYGEGITSSVT